MSSQLNHWPCNHHYFVGRNIHLQKPTQRKDYSLFFTSRSSCQRFTMEKLFSVHPFIGDLPTSAGVEHESSNTDSSIIKGLDLLVFLGSPVTRGKGVFYRLFTCMETCLTYFACLWQEDSEFHTVEICHESSPDSFLVTIQKKGI